MNNRINIERTILAAIIYDNRFASVAHVLSPANFSSIPGMRYREIYSVIVGMFPHEPIDQLTLHAKIIEKCPKESEILDTFFGIEPSVTAVENLVYWAFILLQIDITEKFKKQCVKWKDSRDANFEHVPAAVLKEVIENIDSNTDIFLLIDKATLYFHQQGMDIEYVEATEFYKSLSVRISNLKNMQSINTALRYLLQLCQGSGTVQHNCTTFANAIAYMIINNKSKESYDQAVNIINT